MANLSCLSSTLYIPLQGRVYADMMYPNIFSDAAASQAWAKVSDNIKSDIIFGQTEYTLLASAVRSKNMDYVIQKFLRKNENGAVINVGCGFEDLYSRNDNGKALWFNLDLAEVLEERRKCFGEPCEREYELAYSMFDYRWIDEVKSHGDLPVLLVVSGVFYYFEDEEVIDFINYMQRFDDARLIFDSVSVQGVKVSKKYVDELGKKDAGMKFCFDDLDEFIAMLDFIPTAYKQAKYYSYISKFKGFPADIIARFAFSDKFNMVKMIYIRI